MCVGGLLPLPGSDSAPSLSQVYFRYPSPAASDGDQRSVSHQLVQCVYKKTSYPSPIQVGGATPPPSPMTPHDPP